MLFLLASSKALGSFFELSSPGKAAGIPKAYLCASCLVPGQGTKDGGTVQLEALSVMQGEEHCSTGCVAFTALRNWSCVYLLLVVGRIFKMKKSFPLQYFQCNPLRSALSVQRERDLALRRLRGDTPLLFASCSTDAAFA